MLRTAPTKLELVHGHLESAIRSSDSSLAIARRTEETFLPNPSWSENTDRHIIQKVGFHLHLGVSAPNIETLNTYLDELTRELRPDRFLKARIYGAPDHSITIEAGKVFFYEHVGFQRSSTIEGDLELLKRLATSMRLTIETPSESRIVLLYEVSLYREIGVFLHGSRESAERGDMYTRADEIRTVYSRSRRE